MENLSREKQIEGMAYEIETRTGYLKSTCYISAEILYNADYRKQEWISVEERLPETYDKHLLYLDNGQITIGWYHEGAMQFVEDGIVIINRVTYWMPLPEAPKMKGGAE